MMSEYRIERIFNEGHFLSSIVGTEYFELKLNIYYKLFDKTIPLIIKRIPSQNLQTQIYLRIENVVNASLGFDEKTKTEIEEKLWQGYELSCENSQNPIYEKPTSNNKELNMKFYAIHSKTELMQKTSLASLSTMVKNWDEEDEEIYTSLNFTGEWIGDGYFEICFQGKTILDAIHHQ